MDISTSKTTVKPVKEDVVRPAELREKVVEMGSRTGNDDNVPEQFMMRHEFFSNPMVIIIWMIL